MRALGVVVDKPGVEIGLQRLDRLVEGFTHLDAEELVQDGTVETLDETIGFR